MLAKHKACKIMEEDPAKWERTRGVQKGFGSFWRIPNRCHEGRSWNHLAQKFQLSCELPLGATVNHYLGSQHGCYAQPYLAKSSCSKKHISQSGLFQHSEGCLPRFAKKPESSIPQDIVIVRTALEDESLGFQGWSSDLGVPNSSKANLGGVGNDQLVDSCLETDKSLPRCPVCVYIYIYIKVCVFIYIYLHSHSCNP